MVDRERGKEALRIHLFLSWRSVELEAIHRERGTIGGFCGEGTASVEGGGSWRAPELKIIILWPKPDEVRSSSRGTCVGFAGNGGSG